MGEDTFDADNPDDIAMAVNNAIIQVFGTAEQKTDIVLSRREACHERGYHRVSSDEARLCYDCETLVLNEEGCLPYKVEPLLK
ncbi:hypothetical protein KY346_04360 [Candidatus Woesearchaeota archaeon]|nr:hypothetical protein [Candidatus Woesearchaeota archaeon]